MQTTTPTAAPAAPKPRSRYRSLEFVLGAVLTGLMVLLVLTSGWLFPDGGEAMDLAARPVSYTHLTLPTNREV